MYSSNDTKKLVYIGIAAAVVIVGGVLLGLSGVMESATPSSELTFDKVFHDFGAISMANGKIAQTFLLTNTGSQPVRLTDIRTSCMCTEAVIDNEHFSMHGPFASNIEIEPGKPKEVKVVFDPNAHGPGGVGQITREIYLKTNSTATPELSLRVIGNVTP